MRYPSNQFVSSRHSFTLVELLIVIVIIGVISSFALPQYTRSLSIAKERRVLNNLFLIYNAQLTYMKNNGTYWPTPGPMQSLAAINTNLGLNILADGDTYTCRFRPSPGFEYECLAQFDNGTYELKLDESPIVDGVNPCCNAGACPLTAACP